MDGLEVTKQLREWRPIPIIVLSARGQEKDKVEALDAGADDYLTKPFGYRTAPHDDEFQRGIAIHKFGDVEVDFAKRRYARR